MPRIAIPFFLVIFLLGATAAALLTFASDARATGAHTHSIDVHSSDIVVKDCLPEADGDHHADETHCHSAPSFTLTAQTFPDRSARPLFGLGYSRTERKIDLDPLKRPPRRS